jgi:predicted enzyme related to lactoylglutathione lyase
MVSGEQGWLPIVPPGQRQTRSRWRTLKRMTDQIPVRQLRLCVTASDYDEALRFYRDLLGLPERASYSSPASSPGGRVTILEVGMATLELADPVYAEYIDQVEVGNRVAGHIRVAFEVDDCPTVTATLADAGAELIAPPTRTPWNSLNARLAAPAGLQVTVFAELGTPSEPSR